MSIRKSFWLSLLFIIPWSYSLTLFIVSSVVYFKKSDENITEKVALIGFTVNFIALPIFLEVIILVLLRNKGFRDWYTRDTQNTQDFPTEYLPIRNEPLIQTTRSPNSQPRSPRNHTTNNLPSYT